MTTTLETSLPIPVLVAGAIVSIVASLFLFRAEMPQLTPQMRWLIGGLRTVLCLLVWVLIAQPKAVTTNENEVPLTTQVCVDVSGSMSLEDNEGINTSLWQDQAEPTAIEESLALTEAAKIRLQLLKRHFRIDSEERNADLARTREILETALQKIAELNSTSEYARLLQHPREAITNALGQLDALQQRDAIRSLSRGAGFVADAATSLRRIREAQPQPSGIESPLPRIDAVNQWLKQSTDFLGSLASTGDLQMFRFADAMVSTEKWNEPLEPDPMLGEGTSLYGNLDRLVDEEDSDGKRLIVLITDGVNCGTDDQLEVSARVNDQPLLVLPIGDPSSAPDVAIESVISPARIRENDTFVAKVELSLQNMIAETISVSLLDGSQRLASRDVELDGRETKETVELEWTASGLGGHDLSVEVTSVTGEELLANNLEQVSVQVTKDTYRVLVCDSKPRWETRYLQNLFKRDPSIEMASLLFEPRHVYPGKEMPPPPALPLTLEVWQRFDLVILGDVAPRHLTPEHQGLLVEFVNGGGNLLLLAGTDFMPAAYADTPVEQLVPMLRSQAKPIDGTFVILPAGKKPDPLVRLQREDGVSVWRDLFTLTPQHRLSAWSTAKETARPLLIAEDSRTGKAYDFMATHRFGRGNVCYASAPCLYHLRTIYGDRYHARFWGQMIRGICVDTFGFEGGLVKSRLDRTIWPSGAEVSGRVRLSTQEGLPMPDIRFSAELMDGDEVLAQMQPIADPDRPGDYFLRFPDTKPGHYHIEYSGVEIEPLLQFDRLSDNDALEGQKTNRSFTVLPSSFSLETVHGSKPSPFWEEVNNMPMAATLTPQTLQMVVEALDLKPELLTETSKRPLWDVWWFLVAMILVASSEWLLRRTHGLS